MTIVAVFVPVAFMSGMVGQFFRQFGLTIVGGRRSCRSSSRSRSTRCSRPASRRRTSKGKRDPWAPVKRPFEAVLGGIDALYRSVLGWSVRHKLIVGAIAIGSLFGMGIDRVKLTGSEFVSEEDRGQFVVGIELPAGTALDETRAHREARRDSVPRRQALRHRLLDARQGRRHEQGGAPRRRAPQGRSARRPCKTSKRSCAPRP